MTTEAERKAKRAARRAEALKTNSPGIAAKSWAAIMAAMHDESLRPWEAVERTEKLLQRTSGGKRT